jgi:hypothetical protein
MLTVSYSINTTKHYFKAALKWVGGHLLVKLAAIVRLKISMPNIIGSS